MGYISIQINKAKGSADTGASDHIERKTIPKNADPTRTCLNRELVDFPDGVTNRTEAINHRIRTAGIKRKITPDQVRAIRIVLSGTHEDMMKVQDEGRLNEWCADNLQWLHRTFGRENTVSAVLHMDEHTPHIHATVVPIVTGERRKAKKKQQVEGKRTYRKKTDAIRLCADDVLTREKLSAYHDSYAEAMAKYSLQRGIRGSEARHTTTAQYYRDLKRQTGELEANVQQLQTERQQAEQKLDEVKQGIKSEKLEAAKTEAKAALVAKVGSLLGSGKLKELEATAQATGLAEDAQAAKDLADKCNRFEKKIYDLELTRTISIQTAPQIRMIQNNDNVMVEKIQTTLMNTIPLWKNQMVLALGIAHSNEAAQAQRQVNDITNALLKQNAEKLHMASVETAKEAERGIVDIETLKKTNAELIQTLDDVMKIQSEGREKRIAAEAEMAKMENDLKGKLLEIRGGV